MSNNRLAEENSTTMRLFVAIPLPEPITDRLQQWAYAHKSEFTFRKWTYPQDYHITLQFLGDVEESRLPAIKSALEQIKAAPFAMSLNGAGVFGIPDSPRVLWAAIDGNKKALHDLQAEVVLQMRTVGFVPEARPYSPHITLARKYAGSLPFNKEFLHSAPKDQEWQVDRFVLMRTHMHETPMYEAIATFPLSSYTKTSSAD